jgi:hypothetical protein
MNGIRILALVLVLAGVAGLVYGGFSFTKERHDASIGPIEVSVEEKETVNIPVWAGAGAIVIGALLLFTARKSN